MSDHRPAVPAHVHTWLEAFADCVRRRAFEEARSLMSADVYAFGTRVATAEGWPALFQAQWLPTWMRTRGFRFVPSSLRTLPSPDGQLVVVMAEWSSEGVDTPLDWDTQAPFQREGRATIVLTRADRHWVAAHTHFSLRPDVRLDSTGRTAPPEVA